MSNVYSFLDVTAILTGPGGILNLGAGAGDAEEGITVDPSADVNSMQIGADGQGQHSLSADKSGRVTVRLLKTSPVNAQLQALLAFQRSSAAAHGQNTIVITDVNRGDVITCTQAAFSKQPPMTYAKEAGVNEWEFQAVRIDHVLGS